MNRSTAQDDESARLAAVREYGVDTALDDPGFEHLLHLTSSLFGVPMAMVSLVEAERQLCVARIGVQACEIPRESSFCAHALGGAAVLVVPDAAADPRFRDNPFVVGEPFIRFYAGCPLVAPSGYVLGTLCIMDSKPRQGLSDREHAHLRDLAALVLDKLEMHRLDLARQDSQSRFESMARSSPDAASGGGIATDIIAALSEPMVVEGQPVTIGASIGVAFAPMDGASVRDLLSSADLALYEAKAQGKQCWRFYVRRLREEAGLRRTYQNELVRAYRQGEFRLYYQPRWRLGDERAVIGAQALLWWRHPAKGLLPTGDFLSALESSSVAAAVGDWMLRQACAHVAEWRKIVPDLHLGVSLFGAQLRNGDFADALACLLAANGLSAGALDIEIYGPTLPRSEDATFAALRRLRDMGAGVALGGRGTLDASLGMLRRFPLTRLKIDRSLVHGMLESPVDAAMARAILFLGRSLHLAVTAEGVDAQAQHDRLRRKGCEEAQGDLLGAPCQAEAFAETFLGRRR